jgi:hypothetical protein
MENVTHYVPLTVAFAIPNIHVYIVKMAGMESLVKSLAT